MDSTSLSAPNVTMDLAVEQLEVPHGVGLPTPQVVRMTMTTLTPLQVASVNLQRRHVRLATYQYGEHDRQMMDLFLPVKPAVARLPLVVFVYGGGLTNGDRRLAPMQEAVYQNVGIFFAMHGYACAVIDYRLCPQHDARFPSGGQDIALALQYIVTTPAVAEEVDVQQVYLVGTSAGALHCATYLYCPAEHRTWTPDSRIRIAGFVCANPPASFEATDPDRLPVLTAYFGPDLARFNTINLRKASHDTTPTLILVSEHDLVEEVTLPVQTLVGVWHSLSDDIPRPEVITLQAHNHFSPAMALGLGGPLNTWTDDLLRWMQVHI